MDEQFVSSSYCTSYCQKKNSDEYILFFIVPIESKKKMSKDTVDRDEFIHWDEDLTEIPHQGELTQNQRNRLLSKYRRIEEEQVSAHYHQSFWD